MKLAIDNNGNEVEVSDDALVNTINGIHYLLTPQEQTEYDERNAAYEAGAADRHNQTAETNRRAAYEAESDPLFFKAQRGEATQQEWLDKILEIKNRFPKL